MLFDPILTAFETQLLRERTATALRHGAAVGDQRRRPSLRRASTARLWQILLRSTGTHRPLQQTPHHQRVAG